MLKIMAIISVLNGAIPALADVCVQPDGGKIQCFSTANGAVTISTDESTNGLQTQLCCHQVCGPSGPTTWCGQVSMDECRSGGSGECI